MSKLNELIQLLAPANEGARATCAMWRVGLAFGKVAFRRKGSEVDPNIKTELGGVAIIDAVRIMSGIQPAEWAISEEGREKLPADQQQVFPNRGLVQAKEHEKDKEGKRRTIPIFRGSALN